MSPTGKETSAALKPFLGRAKADTSIAPFFRPWFGAPPRVDLKMWFSYIHQVGMGIGVIKNILCDSYIPREPLSELHLLLPHPYPPPSSSLETVLFQVSRAKAPELAWDPAFLGPWLNLAPMDVQCLAHNRSSTPVSECTDLSATHLSPLKKKHPHPLAPCRVWGRGGWPEVHQAGVRGSGGNTGHQR